jgi:hypothetical protein
MFVENKLRSDFFKQQGLINAGVVLITFGNAN